MNVISNIRLQKYSGTSPSGKMEQMFFLLFVPLSETKNLGYYLQNKPKKTLKGGEKAGLLVTWRPTEKYGNEFSGCSFCFVYPRVEAEEPATQKCQQAQTQ